MQSDKISNTSRLLALIAGICLIISIFIPLWSIELDAPQYPEGLGLLIYPNKIGGDVDIINGLNHYIGMQTLHSENFIEFTILPYLICFFSLLFIGASLILNKKYLYMTFSLFVAFGIIAMADFWRWEYNYGHNLDPNAAIKVPGMAYQPPLIGFKQLLNFGAYSMPAAGGWLFITAGVLMLTATASEAGWFKKYKKTHKIGALVILLLSFQSCSNNGPKPIQLNKDKCDFCKMNISDGRFAAELKTEKGRYYKFDDISCLSAYAQENKEPTITEYYICDYENPGKLIDATKAIYAQSETLRSPMGGNTAAFENLNSAQKMAGEFNSVPVNWSQVQNKN